MSRKNSVSKKNIEVDQEMEESDQEVDAAIAPTQN